MAKEKLNLYKKGFTMCFGCGMDNPIGLKLHFQWDGTTATAEFTPKEWHQGWPGLIHGGLIYALLDEAMSYVPYFWGVNSVTARSHVRFRNPSVMGETLVIRATGERKRSKVVLTKATVSTRSGALVAEGDALMYVISEEQVRAVIWDMDGVIADTARLHFEGWQEVFRARGKEFTWEEFKGTFGLRNDSTIKRVLGEGISDGQIQAISLEKEECFRQRAKQQLMPFPGVKNLLAELAQHKFKQAIASSAPLENISLILDLLAISQFFQALVSADDVTEGKPSPQVFLAAAKKLGARPEDCLVFEDAVAGVEAAKKGGMKCIAVTNTHPAERLSQADLVVDSLEKVDAHLIEQLLKHAGTVAGSPAKQE